MKVRACIPDASLTELRALMRSAVFPRAEMVDNMKSVASADQELTVEERNLLSVAYKNVIGARRASWRIVSSIEQKEETKGNNTQVTMIKGYREKIESELAKICEDILEVLEKHLIPSAASGESKVFYHKMCVTPQFIFIVIISHFHLIVELQDGRLPPLSRRVRNR